MTPRFIGRAVISLPDNLPDSPVLLKKLLFEALSRKQDIAQVYQTLHRRLKRTDQVTARLLYRS